MIPGLGSSAGEGLGYPLQYSWAFLVAQQAKNPPAMHETWVQYLGWEDPMKKEMATHPRLPGVSKLSEVSESSGTSPWKTP